jgi:hypothetical protein
VRAIGVSNFSPQELEQLLEVAEIRCAAPFHTTTKVPCHSGAGGLRRVRHKISLRRASPPLGGTVHS